MGDLYSYLLFNQILSIFSTLDTFLYQRLLRSYGNISITTPDLQVKDGAVIVAGVYGGAGGGNIRVVADTISVTGENLATSGNTAISSSSFFGGNGGGVDIDTGRLFLRASGVIAASTTGNGNAGNLNIRARDSIEVDGAGSVLAQRSRITTSVQLFLLRLRQILGIPGLPTGNGGNLHITTPILQVRGNTAWTSWAAFSYSSGYNTPTPQ
jgi:hypothetical protein